MSRRPFLQALLSAVLFGVATPFSKSLLGALHQNQLAGLLYLGAAAFLIPVVLNQRRQGVQIFPADRRNRLLLLGAVVFGGIVGPLLLLHGLNVSKAASVSMWLNLETVATALIAVALFREHLGRWAWLGNAGVLASGILLGFEGGWAGLTGILFVGGAALAWGLDNNLTAVIDGISPEASTFWKGLVAGGVNLALGMALVGGRPGAAWALALLLGGLSYGASISLYIASAQRMGAARSQMVFASAPFFGVFLSVLWLGEGMSLLQIAAGVLLVGSIGLLVFEQHAHEHVHKKIQHHHMHRHDDGHHDHRHEQAGDSGRHAHPHEHQAVRHIHPHWPDLHHRHTH